MEERKDYYAILGVDKNADKDAIRKAYRDLAKKWHPDKFGTSSEEERKEAERRFKEINEANDVLSDDDKRRAYDNPQPQGMDDDLFREMADHFMRNNPFMNGMGGQRERSHPKGEPLKVVLPLTVVECYNGCEKEVTFQKKVRCKDCNGTGVKGGTIPFCPHCHGRGYFVETQQYAGGYTQTTVPCQHCHGTGLDPSQKVERCPKCGGKGYSVETVTIKVRIPQGVVNGAALRMAECGNDCIPVADGLKGDVFVEIRVKDDSNYWFDDSGNLAYNLRLNLHDALVGCKAEIPTPDGKKYKIDVPEMTRENHVMRLRGKGMKRRGDDDANDLYIVVKYDLPQKLSKKQKELLKEFCNQ